MRKVLKRFKRVARGSDIALLYFSGHGMEMQGDNYLIPIDAELARDDEVEDEAITLEKAQKSLRGARKLRLVILDACRNNPFAAKMTRSAGLTRSVSKGFAPVRVEGNILVAFAAKAGTVAYDGDGQNSPFAGAMLKHLFRPGLDIRRAFGYVRDDVRRETGGKQDPFLYGSLGGDIVPLAPQNTQLQVQPQQKQMTTRGFALDSWERIKNTNDPELLEGFIKHFKGTFYAVLAKKRLKKLRKSRVAVGVFPKQPEPPANRLSYEPEVVHIPGGTFSMGCVSGKDCRGDEKPVHKVTVGSFYLSKYETTVSEYMACVKAGKCRPPEWREKGSKYNAKTGSDDHYKKLGSALTSDRHPIVGVSWNDAVAYARWLSRKTGQTWRLPRAAEWEYAARGDKSGINRTKYSWGNAIGRNRANCDSECKDKWKYTSPVGSFRSSANKFGVYDMHGNVWEWVHDWYGEKYYSRSPSSNPKGPSSGSSRVNRGGGWNYGAWLLRSAYRNNSSPGGRGNGLGFRLLRQPS